MLRVRAVTERQVEVLRIIRRSIDSAGYPPTLHEIRLLLRVRSTNGVSGLLDALEAKGCIERVPRVARGIRLTAKGRRAAGEERKSNAKAPGR